MTHYVRILVKSINVVGSVNITRYFPQFSKDGKNWKTYATSATHGGEISKQAASNVILSYSAKSKSAETTHWIHLGCFR